MSAYKDVSLKIGDGQAKNASGRTPMTYGGVTKKRKTNKSATASTSTHPDGATDGGSGDGGAAARAGRASGRAKGRMDMTLDPVAVKDEGNDDEDDKVSVKSENTEIDLGNVDVEGGVEA
ncbi:MAG: hypothetical protein Q9160_005938 [Pyrenula sp. 1 TL-2023]